MPDDTRLDSASFDLVIVGAGVAGWTAARRAQHLGLRVMVIEKAPEAPGWSNGRLSGGVFHAAYRDPHRPPAELAEALIAAGSGAVDHDVAWAWARNCGRALDFLTAEGARFERQTDE